MHKNLNILLPLLYKKKYLKKNKKKIYSNNNNNNNSNIQIKVPQIRWFWTKYSKLWAKTVIIIIFSNNNKINKIIIISKMFVVITTHCPRIAHFWTKFCQIIPFLWVIKEKLNQIPLKIQKKLIILNNNNNRMNNCSKNFSNNLNN